MKKFAETPFLPTEVEIEAISEPPKLEDSLEAKAAPKKRPIWMHVDPTEADKAEQV